MSAPAPARTGPTASSKPAAPDRWCERSIRVSWRQRPALATDDLVPSAGRNRAVHGSTLRPGAVTRVPPVHWRERAWRPATARTVTRSGGLRRRWPPASFPRPNGRSMSTGGAAEGRGPPADPPPEIGGAGATTRPRQLPVSTAGGRTRAPARAGGCGPRRASRVGPHGRHAAVATGSRVGCARRPCVPHARGRRRRAGRRARAVRHVPGPPRCGCRCGCGAARCGRATGCRAGATRGRRPRWAKCMCVLRLARRRRSDP